MQILNTASSQGAMNLQYSHTMRIRWGFTTLELRLHALIWEIPVFDVRWRSPLLAIAGHCYISCYRIYLFLGTRRPSRLTNLKGGPWWKATSISSPPVAILKGRCDRKEIELTCQWTDLHRLQSGEKMRKDLLLWDATPALHPALHFDCTYFIQLLQASYFN